MLNVETVLLWNIGCVQNRIGYLYFVFAFSCKWRVTLVLVCKIAGHQTYPQHLMPRIWTCVAADPPICEGGPIFFPAWIRFKYWTIGVWSLIDWGSSVSNDDSLLIDLFVAGLRHPAWTETCKLLFWDLRKKQFRTKSAKICKSQTRSTTGTASKNLQTPLAETITDRQAPKRLSGSVTPRRMAFSIQC